MVICTWWYLKRRQRKVRKTKYQQRAINSCVLLIKRLLRLVGRRARKPVNHTSWVALVTPTDRPKSVRNRCLIELFRGVVCVVTLPFWHFCWCRGFCHRTESDLFLFLCKSSSGMTKRNYVKTNSHSKFQVNMSKDKWEKFGKPSGRTPRRTDGRTDTDRRTEWQTARNPKAPPVSPVGD